MSPYPGRGPPYDLLTVRIENGVHNDRVPGGGEYFRPQPKHAPHKDEVLITVILSLLLSKPMSYCLSFRLLNRLMALLEYSPGTRTSNISKGSSFFPVS